MPTLYENISRIENAKVAIAAAIEEKGVDITDTELIDSYAAKIKEIKTGGGGGLDLSGTGWETEPSFPVVTSRLNELENDINYTRELYSKWTPTTKYSYDKKIVYAPKVDTSGVSDFTNFFNSCDKLVNVPTLDLSNATSIENMFYGANSLKTFNFVNTSKLTNMERAFVRCLNLVDFPSFDTSNVTNVAGMFGQCDNLVSIPELHFEKVTDCAYIFDFLGIGKLANIGGFIGVTCNVDLARCPSLTKQSVLNVFNKAGMAKSPGYTDLLISQSIDELLTPDEKAIATNKGFRIIVR